MDFLTTMYVLLLKRTERTYNQRESGNKLSIELGFMRGDQGGFLNVDHKKTGESKDIRKWNNLETDNI
jgi:hypothetical protein